MSKLFDELALKFTAIEKKLNRKINHINSLYNSQNRFLNEHFDDNNNLIEKFSNELNKQREILLKKSSSCMSWEINYVNERRKKNITLNS